MSFRRFADTCLAGSALALALTLAAPAAAQPVDAPAMPALPSASMPMPAAPDMRPEWRGTGAAMQPDGRARDAWLRECRRRVDMYYDGYRSHSRRDRDRAYAGGYDYCEAYFDDYYRTYSQPGYAYAYPMMMHARPMMMAPAPATVTRTVSQPVEEVITEEYVPMRTRTIPHRRTIRRAAPDKRIRIAP